jgi:quercetin dioxygenase-like cupin family protein
MIDLQVEHFFSGGTYAKRMIFPQGAVVPSHKHLFDHMSILAQGRAMVTVNGKSTVYDSPAVIEIKKNQVHTVTALERCHWYCIHATEITDHEKVDETLIVEKENAI